MIIRYVGTSTTRQFEHYTFDRFMPATLVQAVSETWIVQEMLTQPGVDFVVDANDPPAQALGAPRAAELAVLEDITTLEAYQHKYGAPPGKKVFIEEVGVTG